MIDAEPTTARREEATQSGAEAPRLSARRARFVDLRARIPWLLRVIAAFVLVASIAVVIVSYYRLREQTPFRMLSGKPTLAKEVVGVVEGYERRVTEGDRLRLLLRAARDVTYADGHHELEDVYLEYYPEGNDNPDKISARRARYDQQSALINFAGEVRIETRDHLRVETEEVIYHQQEERVEVPVAVAFARENVRGKAGGATVEAKNRRLELRNGVEITVEPQGGARGQPVVLRAAQANFDQASSVLAFSGGATAEHGREALSAETLTARLASDRKVQRIEARANASLRSLTEGRAAEVLAAEIDLFFDADQRLERATAAQNVRARTLDADAETTVQANEAQLAFAIEDGRSLLREMRIGGRPVITLAAPRSQAGDPRAANKRLTADVVRLFWRATGRDLERAEATGNAELVVEPVRPTPQAERKRLFAPRFDADFYENGNLARQFTATGGARAVFSPVSGEGSERVLTAQMVVALFARATQDVETVEARGDARFNEAARAGQADNVAYSATEGMVRLRGGEPTVWDDRARLKAQEIDSDVRREISFARGRVAATYYSQEQTGGAAPFAKTKSPVFVTAAAAEFHHRTGLAIFTGSARMWQDDNFVRAERLVLRREERRMEAEGKVQSAFYQLRRKGGEIVPVFALADRMAYSEAERLIRYEGDVDVRQGTDRITSETAEVYLDKGANEVERTIAQRNVVVTQPGRRGVGEWAQYTASNEMIVLTGSPARVEDVEQGSTEGRRLTVYLRERRVVAEGGDGPSASGRVRSTHRVRRQN
ncbi:MAG: LPS export ABC transporter periplasmic protein LptC [Pyrinomonas sp.]|uniref:LPS export ABC transporter periplasmic protein LptC n=1 Tax=Pyrinomonas sp. TaxID=2080306 RepID=UPI00333295B5